MKGRTALSEGVTSPYWEIWRQFCLHSKSSRIATSTTSYSPCPCVICFGQSLLLIFEWPIPSPVSSWPCLVQSSSTHAESARPLMNYGFTALLYSQIVIEPILVNHLTNPLKFSSLHIFLKSSC